jgi:hypothetical protein
MFITDEVYTARHKIDTIKLFKYQADDIFIGLLTTTRIFLFSFIMYQKNELTQEEREEFGLIDEIDVCFNSIDRKEYINTFLFLLCNYTYSIEEQLVNEAFDMAIKAYDNAYTGKEKEFHSKAFHAEKKKIIKQYIEGYDNTKFFELFEKLVLEVGFTDKEKKKIYKTLENKFEDLQVFDLEYVKKKLEEELRHEQNKKTVQKIYDSFRK